MKKLIPALCMLLVAAALLGTSTFAWFSMNTEVEATGMKVQATTSSNLVIKNSSGDWTRSATATYTNTNTLTPASTSTSTGVLSAAKFFYVTNSGTVDYDTGAADADDTIFAAATVTNDAANTYVSANTFTIAVEGTEEYDNLYVSAITVSDVTEEGDATVNSEISKALRVAVVTTSKAYIFAPVSGATTSYKGIIAAGTGTATTLSTNNETITNAGTDATLGAVSASTTVDVTVYVWYEGQDANCTSGNAVNVENLSVSVQFVAINNP